MGALVGHGAVRQRRQYVQSAFIEPKGHEVSDRPGIEATEKSGCEKEELHQYLLDILEGKQKSSFAFCTDKEAAIMDKVIASVLHEQPGLMNILRQRYIGKGGSLKSMAADLYHKRPEWCLRT